MRLFLVILTILTISLTANAAKYEYDCTDWVVNGGGTGSCSGDTIIFTATDNYVTDGSYHSTTNSGFTISNGVPYYITWITDSGSYNNAGLRITNSTAESSVFNYTFGDGPLEATINGIAGANSQLMWDNNGGGGEGHIHTVCISDVSYEDCRPTQVTGEQSTSTQPTYNDWVYMETLQLIMLSFVPLGLIMTVFKKK